MTPFNNTLTFITEQNKFILNASKAHNYRKVLE